MTFDLSPSEEQWERDDVGQRRKLERNKPPVSNRLREHYVSRRGHISKLKGSGFDGHSLPFLGKGVGYSSMIPVTFFLFCK